MFHDMGVMWPDGKMHFQYIISSLYALDIWKDRYTEHWRRVHHLERLMNSI